MNGTKEIHNTLIHHRNIYPENILIVHGDPERVLWIDFDVAVTFPSKELMGHDDEKYSHYEVELVASIGEHLVRLHLRSFIREDNLT